MTFLIMKKGLFVKNPGNCSVDFTVEVGVLKEMKAQKASFFQFGICVWDSIIWPSVVSR